MKVLNWLWHTSVHKFWIMFELMKFSGKLFYRGLVDDLSKYSLFEVKGYSQTLHKLKGTTYGTDEYKALLEELKPVIQHHYAHNRHHPEFYKNGVEDMAFIDVVEMFIDWKVACKKHADGDLSKSLGVNEKRFELDPQLTKIMRNSI
jgi:hypothetical protein